LCILFSCICVQTDNEYKQWWWRTYFEAVCNLLQLDLKSILDTGEVIEMAPKDADNVRISLDSADQFSVAPSSTANITVTSNSKDSFPSDATLTGSIWLHDKTQTIPSSEIKTSWTVQDLSRPFNKEVMSNNKQARHIFCICSFCASFFGYLIISVFPCAGDVACCCSRTEEA
jgi:hypothetical protein